MIAVHFDSVDNNAPISIEDSPSSPFNDGVKTLLELAFQYVGGGNDGVDNVRIDEKPLQFATHVVHPADATAGTLKTERCKADNGI